MDRMDKFYSGEMGELYKVESTDQLREGNILAILLGKGSKKILIIKVEFSMEPRTSPMGCLRCTVA